MAPTTPRLVGRLSRAEPHMRPAVATIAIDRSLKSGALDLVPLSEEQILDLIQEGARVLRGLQDARRRGER